MNKFLTILGMLLLVAAFMAPGEALAQAPLLISPVNAYQATVNSTGSVTLSWIPTMPSVNYILQVSPNADFSDAIFNAAVGNVLTKTVTGLSPKTTYYWHVSAYYWTGIYYTWSSYTNARSFSIVVPELLSPTNGATDQSQPLNLTWRAIADPLILNTGHQILIDDNSDFSSPEKELTTRGSSYSVSGLDYNTKYYWKVSYYYINIKTGATTYYDWSVTRNFTTGCDVAPTPALSSPANGASGLAQPINLTWSAATNADDYSIQISKNTNFSPTVVNTSTGGATNYEASGLENGTTYYWQVGAHECAWGSYSSYRSFTTECPEPDPPGLVSPANGATGLSMPFTLEWNDVATAIYYGVAIDDNSNFSSPVISEQPSSSQYQVSSGLTDGVTYYWRVYTHDDCGNSVWGPYRSFTMACPTPAIPTLELPPNDITDMSQPVALDWADVSGASKYHLQVADDPGFGVSSLIFNASAMVSSSSSVSGMIDATKYYWRVKAGNDCGSWSGWSDVRNFTTDCPVLGPPTLSLPANNEDGLDVREQVSLTWGSVDEAIDYNVQVSDDAGFSNIIASNVHASSGYTISYPLQAGTWYYWRVKTNNACGAGAWGTEWKFQPNCPTAGVPTPEAPSDGALSVIQPIALDWSDVAEATKYHVQVDNDADFGSMDVNDENVAVSALTLPNLLEGTTYHWRVSAYNGCQWGEWSDSWTFVPGVPSDVEIIARDEIPESFILNQNYPNPFNPSTTIGFALPRAAYVNLEILNILGEKVETLVSRPMSAGSYSVIWDASNVPSGVYFYKINAGSFSETKKMTLIK